MIGREEYCVGRRTMKDEEDKAKRRWLDTLRGDIKQKDCQWRKCVTVLHGGVYRQTSTPHTIWKRRD